MTYWTYPAPWHRPQLHQWAVQRARAINDNIDLSTIRVGLHDEIFQGSQPVLVGVDVGSTYCYLQAPEARGDGDTWPDTPCHGDVFHILQQFKALANIRTRSASGTRSKRVWPILADVARIAHVATLEALHR